MPPHTERPLTPLEVRMLAALKALVAEHPCGLGPAWAEARRIIAVVVAKAPAK